MTLQSKFDQFRQAIEPTENQREQIVGSHTHLRQTILQKLTYVKNTFLTGSYKRRTLIRPLNDVDIFVILNYNPGAYGNPTPQSILNRLKQDLTATYPSTTIMQDKPCITLDFNHCKFELTPAIEGSTWGGNYYEIPNPLNLNAWQRIDSPDVLGEQLTKANNQNSLLIPLIKMMKKCKVKNNLKKPKSFELEVLAIRQLGYVSSYRDGVTRLLEIYGWINSTEIYKIRTMTDNAFGSYCRNTLFGNEFPQ